MPGPHKSVVLSADAIVKTTPGVLHAITISGTAASSAEILDSDGGSDVWAPIRAAANDSHTVEFPGGVAFDSLYIDNITGTAAKVAISYA